MKPSRRNRRKTKDPFNTEECSRVDGLVERLASLSGSETSSVDAECEKYDRFVVLAQSILAPGKRYYSGDAAMLIRRRLKERLQYIGAQHFYQMGEFYRNVLGESLAFTFEGSRSFETDPMRWMLQKYLSAKVSRIAEIEAEFYELENGQPRCINHARITMGSTGSTAKRVISSKDFPQKEGIIRLYIREGGVQYALEARIERRRLGEEELRDVQTLPTMKWERKMMEQGQYPEFELTVRPLFPEERRDIVFVPASKPATDRYRRQNPVKRDYARRR
ncbi:hypothetical protein HY491_03950 [Candidatus Woesearchaeota archaeon]|nr:hypothetical protein [Candidatus Woesearchaeota archaeon]